jgi:hypothetical protein
MELIEELYMSFSYKMDMSGKIKVTIVSNINGLNVYIWNYFKNFKIK